ncbi:MAG TPA: hypothetical protein VK203_12710 [Nostocaceae cyanobacterium]|nr:hypothetical protein [Nostocaceae cyanobacterium]
MASRFSDISKGPSLNADYTEYQNWLRKGKGERRTAYRAVAKPTSERSKPERTQGFIRTFNSANGNIILPARVLAQRQEGAAATLGGTCRNLVDDRIFGAAPNGPADAVVTGVQNYTFAKIVVSEYKRTTNDAKSRMTGRTYDRNVYDNVSCPFGRKAANESYGDAIAIIRNSANYKTFVEGNSGKNRITFKPEIG